MSGGPTALEVALAFSEATQTGISASLCRRLSIESSTVKQNASEAPVQREHD
jgi:hypothetical protein